VVALQVMMEYLRQQPPGTRLDALHIRTDVKLIQKQLNGRFECKSQTLMPYYFQALGMFRQCIDAYMTPWTIEEIGYTLHPDIPVWHIPRWENPIAQGKW
jgi:hypothetical protein